ncbi:zinc finger protein 2 homolog [Papilio machaon]|uniref:zinc finger protein 2 homolog n=1 Tax=Papilio machaon TaxID=76193 RepID=UPI001E662A78|nr:zinc finger protein 2 homolog [Papilio machaon]
MEAWANLCRCCLSPDSGVPLLDSAQNVNSKFQEVTTLEVKEDDGLPQKLCEDCYSILNSAYHFRKQCLKMDKELRYQLDLLKEAEEEQTTSHKKHKKKKGAVDVDNETMKQLEGIIKSEPIDVDDDDDYYYVLVIDDEKKKAIENQELAESNIKIEEINEPENEEVNEEEQQNENQDTHFEDSIDSFLLTNSKVSDRVPATILENEESQDNDNNFEDMHVDETENENQLLPHLIQTQSQDAIEMENNSNEIQNMGQISKNSNLIKILTSSGNERTLMVKKEHVKYLSGQQYISIEDDEGVTTQEEVILCEGDDSSQFQILKCDGSELVIEYADDSEITTVMQQEDGTFVCDCGEQLQNLDEYEQHQHQHNPAGEHLCNLCGKGFETSEILIGHMLLHNVTGPVVTCPFCKQLIRRNSLTQHIKYVHNNKPRCNVCFKTFANQHNLKRHMMIHNDIREFECDICLKRFHQKITMQTHRLNHLNAFSCNQCDMTFKTKEALTTHRDFDECSKSKVIKAKEELMKTVKQEITTNLGKVLGYACSLCKKMFSLESALEQHIESTHIVESEFSDTQKIMRNRNIKRFECHICGKSCASQAMLTMHERVHTNERPFPCQLCPLRFKTKTHLRTHQLTHTREKKFGCSVCMKFFALKGNLVVHLRTHTGERPYVCSICGEGFIDSKYLKKHKLKKHTIENVSYNKY